jgi:hypothetical protein
MEGIRPSLAGFDRPLTALFQSAAAAGLRANHSRERFSRKSGAIFEK